MEIACVETSACVGTYHDLRCEIEEHVYKQSSFRLLSILRMK